MSDKRKRITGILDIIIIATGYILSIDGILRGGQDALMAFLWGQVALFWYFRIFKKQKSESTENPST